MNNSPYNKNVSIDQRIQDCINKRNQLNDRIARLEQVKVLWNNLPFKEGDVAFHKEYGNILVKSIEYGTTEDELEDIKYNVITCHKGTVKVSFREVIPITETTKLLYEKK